jgi:hypothetical protein
MKSNINRDLRQNDRLYVGSAGNDGAATLSYPAAHDNVLGVTGAMAHRQQNNTWRYSAHHDSNYWALTYPTENSAYAISGIYAFDNDPDKIQHPNDVFSGFQALPVPPGWGNDSEEFLDGAMYYTFNGATSSAAAQISALAFLLYDVKARQTGNVLASSYTAVRYRIVYMRNADLTYNNDPNHRLAGVANYWLALTGW